MLKQIRFQDLGMEIAMRQAHFWLREVQFERLVPHLPTDTRGKPKVDYRRVISGIVHVLKSGCGWWTACGDPDRLVYGEG